MHFKPSIRERLLLELIRLQQKVETARHDLRYLAWECTLRCNMRCRHCSPDCGEVARQKDMPLEDFLRVVDRIAEVRKPAKTMIGLTGGEPLVRKDLERAGTEFSRRGFPWGIVTNGYALTEQRLAALVEAGIRYTSISLDGLEQSHNWHRGRDDAFEKTIKAVALAAQHPDVKADVITCVNQRSFGELEDLKHLLIDKGITEWRIETIFPKGRAKGQAELDVSNEQFRDLMEFVQATRAEGIISPAYACEGFLGPYERKVRGRSYFCWAGIYLGSVLADGSITGCPSLGRQFIQGNIYQDDFIDVWNNRFGMMRDRRWTKTGQCATCDAYRWCGGNGLHLREEGSPEPLRCHLKMIENAS